MPSFLRSGFVPALAVLILSLPGCSRGEKTWYLMEHDGAPVGYLVVTLRPGDAEKGTPDRLRQEILLRSSLLGKDFDLKVREDRTIDPASGRVRDLEGELTAGDLRMASRFVFEGDSVRVSGSSSSSPRTLAWDDDVVVPDPRGFPFLAADGVLADGDTHDYRVLDMARGAIQDVRFTRLGRDTLVVAEAVYPCSRVRMEYPALGASQELWLDREGNTIRSRSSDGLVTTRVAGDVSGKVERWNWDEAILAPVDLDLEDFRSLAYLKVEADLRSRGRKLTPADLNVPGQRFEGTVEDNRVVGTFTVEHARYDGEHAPPFPSAGEEGEELAPYLRPEFLIESDDPVLIEEAERITDGAADRWEAALRLARWICENIEESVPGASARQTYDARRGECSAHSRLMTALCRAVGIPARTASGCMYTPIRGGTFGQHVWNEVYLGEEAGWVSLDTAVREPDYIDSGHIRLGAMVSFEPVKMEVLDYRTALDGGTPD